MRLTEEQVKVIKEEVRQVFGPDAQTWLFGSRVDDSKRGGDIDLLIEADMAPEESLDKELRLYTSLIRRMGDRRIDIIVHRTGAPLYAVHEIAMQTGLRL